MAKNFRGCGENLALDLFPLGGGLDNDIGTGHRVQLHDRLDTSRVSCLAMPALPRSAISRLTSDR